MGNSQVRLRTAEIKIVPSTGRDDKYPPVAAPDTLSRARPRLFRHGPRPRLCAGHAVPPSRLAFPVDLEFEIRRFSRRHLAFGVGLVDRRIKPYLGQPPGRSSSLIDREPAKGRRHWADGASLSSASISEIRRRVVTAPLVAP